MANHDVSQSDQHTLQWLLVMFFAISGACLGCGGRVAADVETRGRSTAGLGGAATKVELSTGGITVGGSENTGGTSCPAGEILCEVDAGSKCVDVLRDSAHCGACGIGCAPRDYCSQGSCAGCVESLKPYEKWSQSTGPQPLGLSVVDLNRDGKLDLVTANDSAATVSVLLGRGDGSFDERVDYQTGTNDCAWEPPTPGAAMGWSHKCLWFTARDAGARSVTTGDFNRDGIVDLAVVNEYSYTVSLLSGRGDGTFREPMEHIHVRGPWIVAAADFNGDLAADLAILGVEGVNVILGQGDGSFGSPSTVDAVGYWQSSVFAVGDANGDGHIDIVNEDSSTPGIRVHLGRGDGSFAPPLHQAVTGYLLTLQILDVDLDGRVDLRVTTASPTSVVWFTMNADGAFESTGTIPVDEDTRDLATADFNGDGRVDIATIHGEPEAISFFWQQEDGGYALAGDVPIGEWETSMAVGDFNGDGVPDLVEADAQYPGISTFLAACRAPECPSHETVRKPGSPVARLSLAGTESCARLQDGRVLCWGGGTRWRPEEIPNLTNVIDLAVGVYHSCALRRQGTVQCWGANWAGQLGDGTTTNRITPVAVTGLSEANRIATGICESLAWRTDGTVFRWGAPECQWSRPDTIEQIGLGRLAPELSKMVEFRPWQMQWEDSSWCARWDDNRVSCEHNIDLMPAVTNDEFRARYVMNLSEPISISAGALHACALLKNGTVSCWCLVDDRLSTDEPTLPLDAKEIADLAHVVQITLGVYHSCARLENGTVKCWLYDDTCTKPSPTVELVSGLSAVIDVAAGAEHTCVVLENGSVKCWGDNSEGQLGNDMTDGGTGLVSPIGLE